MASRSRVLARLVGTADQHQRLKSSGSGISQPQLFAFAASTSMTSMLGASARPRRCLTSALAAAERKPPASKQSLQPGLVGQQPRLWRSFCTPPPHQPVSKYGQGVGDGSRAMGDGWAPASAGCQLRPCGLRRAAGGEASEHSDGVARQESHTITSGSPWKLTPPATTAGAF